MEAGGFEPPSRDTSRQTSTYLVGSFLALALTIANRQAIISASPISFALHPQAENTKLSHCSTLCPYTREMYGRTGCYLSSHSILANAN